jgi:ATPase family associated with various cellular activities (AAA)
MLLKKWKKMENNQNNVSNSSVNTETIKQLQNAIRKMATRKRRTIGLSELDSSEYLEYNSLGLPSPEEIEEEIEEESEYPTNGESFGITFIEFAIFNEYFYETYRKKSDALTINSYGSTDSVGRVSFGAPFNVTSSWWFNGNLVGDTNEYIFQTKMFLDGNRTIITELHISPKNGMSMKKLTDVYKKVKGLAFNNSKFKGKCIEVKLYDGNFKGIDIIDMSKYSTNLILSETQRKFIDHFINRVARGGNARYLLNGEPGTGKTESIREVVQKLIPDVTFIIPKFNQAEDLTVILEACEIFDKGVIIMDDIDLYLGSRDRGSYTNLLGQFLSFFDGVKKRKISLLASTNDKGLVDKAAERPGRFNMTLDYTFLTREQIVGVCKIHLPAEYCIEEIYDVLTSNIDGKSAKITGAFIANLADNIKEMSEDSDNWKLDDTISLIKESYKGFYMSQTNKNASIGFKVN